MLRSRFDDGGGLLRADKYHKRKVCQDGIAAHDLSEGEISSILAAQLGFLPFT